MATKSVTGGCLCGKITYAIDLPASEPNPKVVLCHCISCKKYTGSAFSTNIGIPVSALRYTSSTKPTIFTDKSTDSGTLLPRAICAECGTHFTSTPGDGDFTFLKWGTLDDEGRQACSEIGGEIYCKRKDGWVNGIGSGEWIKKDAGTSS